MHGKERNRLYIYEPCRHLYKFACNVHIRKLHLPHIVEILLDKLQNRYIVYIYFMLAYQVQEQIHRSLKHL